LTSVYKRLGSPRACAQPTRLPATRAAYSTAAIYNRPNGLPASRQNVAAETLEQRIRGITEQLHTARRKDPIGIHPFLSITCHTIEPDLQV